MLEHVPRAPRYRNRRSLGYVTIEYIAPSSSYLVKWSPRIASEERVCCTRYARKSILHWNGGKKRRACANPVPARKSLPTLVWLGITQGELHQ